VTEPQPRPSFRPEAVLFDCDGLLLETESRWTIAEKGLLAAHGGTYSKEFKLRLLGTSAAVSQALIAEELGRPPADAPALGAELDARFREAIAEHGTEPMPGVLALLEALEALDARVPIAVASNNGEQIVRVVIELAGVSDHFQAIVCASDTLPGKPLPDVYLAAAAAVGADPSRCVALEDSATGATAARAAGCFTIGVPSHAGAALPVHATYASMHDVGLAELNLAGDGASG
jgi:HAD superfamily hydrolase (TIGR01509 family)